MGILDNLLGKKKESKGYNFRFANDSLTKSGIEIKPEDALKDATVLSCINTLAQTVAQLPLNVLDQEGLQVSGNFQNIINKPNAYQTTYTFKYAIVHSLMAYGNVFIRIIRTKSNTPVQLVLIEPDKMDVESNIAGMPVYMHKDFGEMRLEDIIHIQDIATFDASGKSRVELAAERIGALRAADSLIAATFKNGVDLGYVLTVDPGMDADQFEKLSEGFRQSFSQGGRNRGGASVIQGGTIQAIKGSTPADADLLNLRSKLINEIAAVFKVPTSMVGGDGDQKYSNLRQSQTGFYRDTVAPIIDSIEQSINLKLGNPNAQAKFDVSLLLKGDVESQVRVGVQLVTAGICTPNEAREYLGYDLLEGADTLRNDPSVVNPDDMRGSVDQPNGMNPEQTGENSGDTLQ
jgi:HK97 family phage portal protein